MITGETLEYYGSTTGLSGGALDELCSPKPVLLPTDYPDGLGIRDIHAGENTTRVNAAILQQLEGVIRASGTVMGQRMGCDKVPIVSITPLPSASSARGSETRIGIDHERMIAGKIITGRLVELVLQPCAPSETRVSVPMRSLRDAEHYDLSVFANVFGRLQLGSRSATVGLAVGATPVVVRHGKDTYSTRPVIDIKPYARQAKFSVRDSTAQAVWEGVGNDVRQREAVNKINSILSPNHSGS